MNRRWFLGAIAGLVSAPIFSGLPAIKPGVLIRAASRRARYNPLFFGRLGSVRYVGLHDPKAVKRYAALLFQEINRKSHFSRAWLTAKDGPLVPVERA